MKRFFNTTNLLLVVILAAAAFMRLYKIADYLTFLGDEGRDVLVVYNILHGHLTLLGPTSSVGGFFLGPLYYYFMAPALWIAHYSPVGPAIMIALFGVLTVWFVYYVTAKLFNTQAGLIAALLYAIAPVVILYSRSSWNPNLMPFATLLLMVVLYKAVIKNTWWIFGVVGILFGVVMQLHYIEVFVAVIIPFYILFSRLYQYFQKQFKTSETIRQLVQDYIFFSIGFLVGWSPFLAFEFRHGFNNIHAIINFVFHSNSSGNGVGIGPETIITIGNVFARIFGRLILNIPSPDIYNHYASWQITVWMLASWIIGIGSTIFLFWQIIQYKKNSKKFLAYSLLASWLFVGILFFGLYKKNIYDYYFEFLFPAPFLLVGGMFGFLLKKARWIQITSFVLLIIIVWINLQGVPFRYPGNRQLQQTEEISHFVLSKTDNKPFNFALITGGNSDHAYRYFFTIFGQAPVTIQYPGVDPKRISVTDQLLVVCESVPCQPLGNSLWEIAGFGRADVVGHWTVSVVEVYKLVHYRGK